MELLASILIIVTIAACVLLAKAEHVRSFFPNEELRRKLALYGFAAYVVLLIVVVFGSGGGIEPVYRR